MLELLAHERSCALANSGAVALAFDATGFGLSLSLWS
jgi:hypothetical protein